MEELDKVTLLEQYQSVSSKVEGYNRSKNKLKFYYKEIDTKFVEKINIFGNNVTKAVIRNQLEIDEGDPFNEILLINQ